MSASMYWETKRVRPGDSVDRELHRILAKRYLRQDGTLATDAPYELGPAEREFLSGVAYAHSDPAVRREAEEMMDAIDESGAILIWITR